MAKQTSSVLAEYLTVELQVNELKEKLEALKNDPRMTSEIAFRDKLEAMMADHGKSTSDVIRLLGGAQEAPKGASTRKRKPRAMKVYENPNTGERIETRGGNHKTLKAWKSEFGAEAVEGWLVDTVEVAA